MQRWWAIRGYDRVASRSMLALVVFGALAVLVGLMSWLPPLLGAGSGVSAVAPGRFVVEQQARGTVTLGQGFTVGLFRDGFHYARDDTALVDTVRGGSPLVGVVGSVTAPDGKNPAEGIIGTLDKMHLTSREITSGTARWTGEVSGEVAGGPRVAAVTWEVSLVDERIVTTVTVQGVDGLVIPLAWRPGVVGLAPALPERNLRLKQWWFASGVGGEAAFEFVRAGRVGVGPEDAPRAIDLASDGHVDVHVWSPAMTFTVSVSPSASPSVDPTPSVSHRPTSRPTREVS